MMVSPEGQHLGHWSTVLPAAEHLSSVFSREPLSSKPEQIWGVSRRSPQGWNLESKGNFSLMHLLVLAMTVPSGQWLVRGSSLVGLLLGTTLLSVAPTCTSGHQLLSKASPMRRTKGQILSETLSGPQNASQRQYWSAVAPVLSLSSKSSFLWQLFPVTTTLHLLSLFSCLCYAFLLLCWLKCCPNFKAQHNSTEHLFPEFRFICTNYLSFNHVFLAH
jgi:hypothetical protein